MNNVSRAATSRLSINLDRGLHRAFKLQAFLDETTEAALVRRLIARYLEDPSRLELTEDLANWCGQSGKAAPVNVPPPQPVRAGLPTAPPVPRSS